MHVYQFECVYMYMLRAGVGLFVYVGTCACVSVCGCVHAHASLCVLPGRGTSGPDWLFPGSCHCSCVSPAPGCGGPRRGQGGPPAPGARWGSECRSWGLNDTMQEVGRVSMDRLEVVSIGQRAAEDDRFQPITSLSL